MDKAAGWFFAGVLVSLINTGLVIVFIGIPGITDDDSGPSVAIAPPPRAPAPVATATPVGGMVVPGVVGARQALTFVIVVDQDAM